MLLVHGDRDDLIPVQALFQSAQGLAALGVPVEWHLSAGVGHGIDGEGLRQGGEFLARGRSGLRAAAIAPATGRRAARGRAMPRLSKPRAASQSCHACL